MADYNLVVPLSIAANSIPSFRIQAAQSPPLVGYINLVFAYLLGILGKSMAQVARPVPPKHNMKI